MIKFFNTLQAMHQFTLSLDTHSDTLECQHCLKKDQFVSHGFIYKKQHQNDKQAIGKRIFVPIVILIRAVVVLGSYT